MGFARKFLRPVWTGPTEEHQHVATKSWSNKRVVEFSRWLSSCFVYFHVLTVWPQLCLPVTLRISFLTGTCFVSSEVQTKSRLHGCVGETGIAGNLNPGGFSETRHGRSEIMMHFGQGEMVHQVQEVWSLPSGLCRMEYFTNTSLFWNAFWKFRNSSEICKKFGIFVKIKRHQADFWVSSESTVEIGNWDKIGFDQDGSDATWAPKLAASICCVVASTCIDAKAVFPSCFIGARVVQGRHGRCQHM